MDSHRTTRDANNASFGPSDRRMSRFDASFANVEFDSVNGTGDRWVEPSVRKYFYRPKGYRRDSVLSRRFIVTGSRKKPEANETFTRLKIFIPWFSTWSLPVKTLFQLLAEPCIIFFRYFRRGTGRKRGGNSANWKKIENKNRKGKKKFVRRVALETARNRSRNRAGYSRQTLR